MNDIRFKVYRVCMIAAFGLRVTDDTLTGAHCNAREMLGAQLGSNKAPR